MSSDERWWLNEESDPFCGVFETKKEKGEPVELGEVPSYVWGKELGVDEALSFDQIGLSEELNIKKLKDPGEFAEEAKDFASQMAAEVGALKSFADTNAKDPNVPEDVRGMYGKIGSLVSQISSLAEELTSAIFDFEQSGFAQSSGGDESASVDPGHEVAPRASKDHRRPVPETGGALFKRK